MTDATTTAQTHNHFLSCQSCVGLREDLDAALALLRRARSCVLAELYEWGGRGEWGTRNDTALLADLDALLVAHPEVPK